MQIEMLHSLILINELVKKLLIHIEKQQLIYIDKEYGNKCTIYIIQYNTHLQEQNCFNFL